MNNMDGNPHVDPLADAIIFSAEDAPLQNIEFLLDNLTRATKAVAYEQRTANLISLFHGMGDTRQEFLDATALDFNDWDEIAQQITTRLSLNERTTP